MITIKLATNGERLEAVDRPIVACGDQNSVQIEVAFCGAWDGYAKTAVFYCGYDTGTVYEMILDADNRCLIPAEVLASACDLYIGLRGVKSDGSVLTSEVLPYTVKPGAPGGTETPEDPTPTVYEQILAQLDEVNTRLGVLEAAEEEVTPISKGGTGATTVAAARNALGLGNTSGALPVANGGTGATTVAAARNALGLGNTPGALPIANGGTGATTASGARSNLGITPANLGIDDYVVEEGAGTASGSYYRKWNSGRAEYWHKFNPGALTIGTARGNLHSGSYFDSSFESGLFNDVPQVNCYAHLSTDAYIIGTQVKSISKDKLTLRLWASGSVTSNSGYNIHIYAVGTWK